MNDTSMNRRSTITTLLEGLLGLCLTGCQSVDKPYSASFASVEFKWRTPQQIREAAISVFQEDGYSVQAAGPSDLVFQKEGSRANKVAYGNWVGGPPVYVRVKTAIVPVSEGVYRLQCNAYMVRDANDSHMQDEVKLANIRSGPYQSLLNKVAKRLK